MVAGNSPRSVSLGRVCHGSAGTQGIVSACHGLWCVRVSLQGRSNLVARARSTQDWAFFVPVCLRLYLCAKRAVMPSAVVCLYECLAWIGPPSARRGPVMKVGSLRTCDSICATTDGVEPGFGLDAVCLIRPGHRFRGLPAHRASSTQQVFRTWRVKVPLERHVAGW